VVDDAGRKISVVVVHAVHGSAPPKAKPGRRAEWP